MKKKIQTVRKAVIPAAGWGTRFLPYTKTSHKELVPVLNKPIIHYLAEEAMTSGIEEIVLVVSPRKFEIMKYFTKNSELELKLSSDQKYQLLTIVQATNTLAKISLVIQNEQLGLGHAVYVARDIIGNEPFALMLGDDLIKSKTPVVKQLLKAYYSTGGQNIVGVQEVLKKDIHKYGIVKPKVAQDKKKELFEISAAIEKPDADDAPSNKAILGRYIFNPSIFKALGNINIKKGKELDLVDAFEKMLETEKIFACTFEGVRYDLGSMEGFVKANIDYALDSTEISESIMEHISSKIK